MKKIGLWPTRYSATQDGISVWCVQPEDLANLLTLEGASESVNTDNGCPVVAIETGSEADKETYSANCFRG